MRIGSGLRSFKPCERLMRLKARGVKGACLPCPHFGCCALYSRYARFEGLWKPLNPLNLLADPARFERATFAFGARPDRFSGTIRYCTIAR